MPFDLERSSDTLAEIGSIMMGSGATNMSGVLGRTVRITAPRVGYGPEAGGPSGRVLEISVGLAGAVQGDSVFLVAADQAELIARVMCTGMELSAEDVFGPLGLSALSEAVNQLMAGSAIALSDVMGELVDVNPPALSVVEADEAGERAGPAVLRVVFDIHLGDDGSGQMAWLLDEEFAAALVERALNGATDAPATPPAGAAASAPGPVTAAPAGSAGATAAPGPTLPPGAGGVGDPSGPLTMAGPPEVSVAPAAYPELSGRPAGAGHDLAVLRDVTLHVTVELGRTKMLVREVLALGEGSVVELDRPAGAPVDVLVNGTLVARGDVVVVDDELGVRISEIVRREHDGAA